jgi:peptide/nickel transport system ATP-binding protein
MTDVDATPLRPDVVLRVEGLAVDYKQSNGRHLRAVDGVTFDVAGGETLGLVGESGCGKSTTGRAIVQLVRVAEGTVTFSGWELTSLDARTLRRLRPGFQMVFQDPISSLNPRHRIRDILAEPLRVWDRGTATEREEKIREVLEAVGLEPESTLARLPHEFSGGQCQRISIARALVLDPKLVICDEPVSALDVSVQAQILNLLGDTKARYGLTLVFVSHDLAVVRQVSDRVAVMYLGKLCEIAPAGAVYDAPAHHYTAALIAAIPMPDASPEDRSVDHVDGEPPSIVAPPSGCRFRTRCPAAEARCAAEEPPLREIEAGHHVACHFPRRRSDAPLG